jgi:hypothetical protein
MSSFPGIPVLDRPEFFDGQQLLASDLAEVQRYHRELRWLHNRSLHGWGIAFGYSVTGDRRARSVKLQPGYALDCLGRDLILSEEISMPVPAVSSGSDGAAAEYYLTVSYAEDSNLTPQSRAGVCNTSGAVRRPEKPVIRWQDPNDTDPASRYRHGLDIILGTIKVLHCRLDESISTTERRSAIPAQQPYVAAGQTGVGSTVWRLWPDSTLPLGVATTVSTSSAGFQATPRYQARVAGERVRVSGGQPLVVEGLSQVADATASSFELRVFLPAGQILANVTGNPVPLNPQTVLTETFMGILQVSLQWHVVWTGIEG